MAKLQGRPEGADLRDTNTGRLLLKAMRAFNGRAMGAVRALDHPELSLAHAAVLPHIAASGTRLTELAEKAGLRKQSASQLVEELARAGYVERRPDPADRRAQRVWFTARGRRFLDDAEGVKRAIEASLEQGLGPGSYRELRRLLVATEAALGGEAAPSAPRRRP
jgi:DNA-binding MarR family transcriptional regulator